MRDHRVGLGALRIVDEPHAVDQRDRLETMLDTGERRGRLADRLRLDAEQSPTEIAASALRCCGRRARRAHRPA